MKHSEKTKKKISETLKGQHNSSNTEFKKGFKMPENWKKKKRELMLRRIQEGKHNTWKGGKIGAGRGYVMIYSPNHPNAVKIGNTKYVREHRLMMEAELGRYLKPYEVVHHINGEKSNNKINNLMLFNSHSEHKKYHHKNL